MATTAVITRPTVSTGTEQFVANLTRHAFSAMQSFVGATSDAANRAAVRCSRAEWTFPDAQKAVGFVVQWQPTAAGTGNVVLVVYGDDGSVSAPATLSVTVAGTPTIAQVKYLRSDGSDTAPGHDGSSNDSAHAWLTAGKAFDDWQSHNPHSGFGKLVLNATDTVARGTISDGIDYGAFWIERFGAGANPVVTPPDHGDVILGSGSDHDSGSRWTHPSVVDGVDFVWPVVQVDGTGGSLQHQHVHAVFQNLKVFRAWIESQGTQSILYNVEVSGAQGKKGVGSSSGATFMVVDHCNVHDNGNDNSTHHQGYSTGTTDLGVLDTTLAMGAALCDSGYKIDGTTRAYFGRNTVSGTRMSFDPGANGVGSACSELIYDSNLVLETSDWGRFASAVQHWSIRNERQVGGASSGWLRERSWQNTAPGFLDFTDVWTCSLNKVGGGVFSAQTSFWNHFRMKGSAVVLLGEQYFYDTPSTGNQATDLAKFDCDYNVYWRVGGTPNADAAFALIGSTVYTWAAWQAAGKDVHSVFRDPLFKSDADLTPQTGSPCLASTPDGVHMPDFLIVGWDCFGVKRPSGRFDAGAIQVSTAGGVGNVGLPGLGLHGAGGTVVTGSGSDALPNLGASGVGHGFTTGSGSSGLPPIGATGVGVLPGTSTGSGTVPLPALAASGFGGDTGAGSGTVPLPALAASGFGAAVAGGHGVVALPALGAEGLGGGGGTGGGSVPLPALGAHGVGDVPRVGSGTSPLPALGATGAGNLPNLGGAGVVPLPALGAVGSGSATVEIDLPEPPIPLLPAPLPEQLADALADLFPPGLIYRPRQEGVLRALRLALADVGAELRERARVLVEDEADPSKTSEMLSDWERWLGLPDPSITTEAQTPAQRRAAVVSKLQSLGGQTPAYYRAVAARLGFTVTIEEFDRSLEDSVDDFELIEDDAEYGWVVHAPVRTAHRARAGAMRAGDRTGSFGNALLESFIRAIAPAHTVVAFAYDL